MKTFFRHLLILGFLVLEGGFAHAAARSPFVKWLPAPVQQQSLQPQGPGVVENLVRTRSDFTATTMNNFENAGEQGVPRNNYLVRGYDGLGRVAWEAVYNIKPTNAAKPSGPDSALESMAEYAYDGLGRTTLISRWNFVGGTWDANNKYLQTKIDYDSSTNTVKTTDPEGKVTVMQTDHLGRPLYVVRAQGTADEIKTDYAYKPGDQVTVTSTLPQANQVLQYNAQGSLQTVTAGGQTVMSQTYDSLGRLSTVQAQGLGAHSYHYDAFGQLISEEQQTGADTNTKVRYGYDLNGRRVYVVVDEAHETKYQYDGLDRLVAKTDGLGETKYAYFPGTTRLSQSTDPAGTTRTYGYFTDGHPQSETVVNAASLANPGATTQSSYDYTATGLLKTATLKGGAPDGKDMTVSRTYDSLGRKLTEYNDAQPIGVAYKYAPGAVTRMLTDGDPSKQAIHEQETITYDNLYRTASVKLDMPTRPQPLLVSLQYQKDQNGLLQKTTKTFGNQVTETLSYDALGRPTSVQVMNGNVPIAGETVWRGADDVPRMRTLQLGSALSKADYFESDLAGRLTVEDLMQPPPQSPPTGDATNKDVENALNNLAPPRRYTLDGAANWVSGSNPPPPGAPDAANRYTTTDGMLTYDKAGNLTNDGKASYSFNGLGRLVGVNGDAAKYAYDPLGRRISEDDGKTQLIWDGDDLVAYGPDVSSMRAVVGGSSAHYALVDALGSGSVWYLHDGTDGSTIAATDDSAGQFKEGYSYSGFGETSFWDANGGSLKASAIDNRFLFQGEWFDSSTGTYKMGVREYKPDWGRWLSPDPIGLAGGPSLYAYVGGSPLQFSDPSGLCPSTKGWQNWSQDRGMQFKGFHRNDESSPSLLSELGHAFHDWAHGVANDVTDKSTGYQIRQDIADIAHGNSADRHEAIGDLGEMAAKGFLKWVALPMGVGKAVGAGVEALSFDASGVNLGLTEADVGWSSAPSMVASGEAAARTVVTGGEAAAAAATAEQSAAQTMWEADTAPAVRGGQGTVTVNWFGGDVRHATIEVSAGEEVTHTHFMPGGYEGAPGVVSDATGWSAPDKRLWFSVPDGQAALEFTRAAQIDPSLMGGFNKFSNNCLSYCAKVLNAGGRSGVPLNRGFIRWVQENGIPVE